MEIVSVLDWEWSRVVPVQFFKPPFWLKYADTTKLAYDFVYRDYMKSFDLLLDIVRTREREKYGDQLLSNEWAEAKKDSGFLVANTLENWTDIDWFSHRYLNWKLYKNKGLDERVKAFMEEDSTRKILIGQMLQESITNEAEPYSLDDATIKPAANEKRNKSALSYSALKNFLLQHPWRYTICLRTSIPQMAFGGVLIIAVTYLLIKRFIRNY